MPGDKTTDDDPLRTATYLRGFRNGLEEAAKICLDRAKRYRGNGTLAGSSFASASDSNAFYIRKEVAKIEKAISDAAE